MARSILGQNLDAILEDGSIAPIGGEAPRPDESGHAALALGEFYRATTERTLEGRDLIDLAARCITHQAFTEEEHENGLAYTALGLLSFGPSKDRNVVWERLLDPTRETLDERMLARTDYEGHLQAFNIAKAVARFSMGLSKKDETGKLIDLFIERMQASSSGGYVDDSQQGEGIRGVYDIYGVMSFIFIRQALQLHANIHLRDRKLPSLRTYAEKYIKMMPDLVRADGLGWNYGRGIGAYGQMHCISAILQALRDDWIAPDKRGLYYDVLRRLFHYFFLTYLDQEHGYLVIRDGERTTQERHTTRMANFDAARYLCQWYRLASSIKAPEEPAPQAAPTAPVARFLVFDKTSKKEQGLFLYRDAQSGLHTSLPLAGGAGTGTCDALAFPHCPGIFDWPVGRYLPCFVPELTFDGKKTVPGFYGKRTVTGVGLRKSFFFRFEQPELITHDEQMLPGIGSVKVSWEFSGGKVKSEFVYTVRQAVTMERFRYCLVIAAPHSTFRAGNTLQLGPEGLRCNILRDDFQATWQDTEVVSDEPDYRTYYGKVHYVQTLARDHHLVLRPGHPYKFTVEFEPDITTAG